MLLGQSIDKSLFPKFSTVSMSRNILRQMPRILQCLAPRLGCAQCVFDGLSDNKPQLHQRSSNHLQLHRMVQTMALQPVDCK